VAVILLNLLLVSLLITTQATAQSSGNLCIKEKLGGDPPCTANDVRFAALDVLSGPTGCMLGETINVTVLVTLESGPERFDIGIWINESGGSALSDPDGTCYRDFLDPVSIDNSDCDLDGGPYYNAPGEDDSCGDVPAVGSDPCGGLTGPCSDGGGTCLFTFRTVTLDLLCSDGDGNGFVDAGWATSWDNNPDNDCNDELDTDPGTGSKCFHHDLLDLDGIAVFCTGIDPATECCDPESGEVTPIDDGVDCTEDVCDPNTGIVTHTPNDGDCDDGLFCNGAETCDPVLDCRPGTNPCVPPLFCDEVGDTCIGCLTDEDCDDGVDCTVDTCDSGSCVNTPDDGSCDDGLYCNGAEVCDPISNCQAGTDPCSDGSDCTEDTCDEDTDTCENLCVAEGWDDPCCDDIACSGAQICQKEPSCGDGFIDPGEICGEPGLEDGCPADAPICLDCVDCGIPVELLYFRAIPGADTVRLVWATAAEIDTAGFNILRSESQDGTFEKINDVLIPGEGEPTQGASYSYIDDGLESGVTYWYQLQDVDDTGEKYIHDITASAVLSQGACSGSSEAQASEMGGATGADSVPINAIALFLLPIGIALILRVRQKK
jgi:hypothetical protein